MSFSSHRKFGLRMAQNDMDIPCKHPGICGDDAGHKDEDFVPTARNSNILPSGKSLPHGRFLSTEKVLQILQHAWVKDTTRKQQGQKSRKETNLKTTENRGRVTAPAGAILYTKMENCGQVIPKASLEDQVPVLECDDEKALKMAMALALNFPSAPRPTCTRHLKQNFSHALADKVGLTKQEQDFTASSVMAITQAGRTQSENPRHRQESTQRSTTGDLCRRVCPR
ncbi:hypothetical protein RRG08_018862 [Elysia crispata]|uniref:Uncharacterized protein n=1 Tax=Elysia crispata TaxID=231223 RepID=A0AAE1EAV2_9GAST|nr:hypothetical protein RRG08_018862 [Elysia crispata]